MKKEFAMKMNNLSNVLKKGGYNNIASVTSNMTKKGFTKEVKLLSKNLAQEGGNKFLKEFNKIAKNDIFTLIVCLFLAFYSAKVAQNHNLPSSLYWIYDNLISKILAFFVIIIVAQINLPIAIFLMLSYVILLMVYKNQNNIELFVDKENKIYIEKFTNSKREHLHNMIVEEEMKKDDTNIYQQALKNKNNS